MIENVIEFLFNSPLLLLIVAEGIGILSLILYFAEAIVIRRTKKQFNSSYYSLIFARFLANLISYTMSYPFYRFGNANLFFHLFEKSSEFLLRLIFSSLFYTFHTQNLATFFVLLNRFTSVAMPTRHLKMWWKLLPICVAAIFIAPLPLSFHNLFAHSFYVKRCSGTFEITYRGEVTFQFISNSFMAALLSVVFCVTSILLNGATILVYRKNRSAHIVGAQIISKHERKRHTLEYRLTVYAIATFVAQACMALFMIVLYLSRITHDDRLYRIVYNLFPLFNDLFTIGLPAWLMLWADSEVRAALFAKQPFARYFRATTSAHAHSVSVVPRSPQHVSSSAACPTRNAFMIRSAETNLTAQNEYRLSGKALTSPNSTKVI